MVTETTFLAGKDLTVIEGEEVFVLRKGFLHVNEISIDKRESSKNFIKLFRTLIQERSLCLADTNTHYNDFMKLVQFGLLDIKTKNNFLIVIDDKIYDALSSFLTAPCLKVSECFTREFLAGISGVDTPVKEIFAERIVSRPHICYLGLFRNLSHLRAINKFLFNLNLEYTIGFVDENNVYVTGVRPHYSGCYSCLEQKIISHFPGNLDDYVHDADTNSQVPATAHDADTNSQVPATAHDADTNSPVPTTEAFEGQLLMLASLIRVSQHNIELYDSSPLIGSVVHFYLPNFEYTFEKNRKDSACKVCSGINNARFEEQNILSVNLVKGMER